MGIPERLAERREEILAVAERHGASNVRVFGSVARGEARPESDVDLLVDFSPRAGLMDQVALLQELEDLLAARVDVVSATALHWYIRDRALAEAVPL